jgi:hypothetical protein
MAHYDDLSPCTYFGDALPVEVLAVGWLEPGFDFPTGDPGGPFYAKLKQLAHAQWVNSDAQFMGGHRCEFCRFDRFYSSLNLFVPGDGVTYVVPEAIVHYVAVHRYQPPQVFCDAVLACPPMTSPDYFSALHRCGWTKQSATPDESGAERRRWRIEQSLGWAARHLALAQIALYHDVHGCMPTQLDQLGEPYGQCGLQYQLIDPTHRLSYQQETVGPVVQFDMPSPAQECWELRDGDWMRHRGFTESDSDSDRASVERVSTLLLRENRAVDPGHLEIAPLFHPTWPR